MNIKRIKLLVVASIIDICLGVFLLICGLLEFTGILYTNANTTIESVGVQLSYLVFMSGILTFVSGLLTMSNRKTMSSINVQIVIGLAALAWPIFVSISLFFSQYIICVRLLPTMLTSLFYMIAIMIVKISNESLRKVHHISTSNVQLNALSTAANAKKANIGHAISSGIAQNSKSTGAHLQNIGKLASGKKKSSINLSSMFQGKRRSGPHMRGIYSGSRRRGGLFRRHR